MDDAGLCEPVLVESRQQLVIVLGPAGIDLVAVETSAPEALADLHPRHGVAPCLQPFDDRIGAGGEDEPGAAWARRRFERRRLLPDRDLETVVWRLRFGFHRREARNGVELALERVAGEADAQPSLVVGKARPVHRHALGPEATERTIQNGGILGRLLRMPQRG